MDTLTQTTHAPTAHRNLKKGGSVSAIKRRASDRVYRSGLDASRIASGLCLRCGSPVDGGYKHCAACRDKSRRRAQATRDRSRAVLLKFRMCLRCQKEQSLPKLTICRNCHENDRQYKLAQRLRRISKGLCTICGAKAETGKCCDACKAKALIRNRASRAKRNEQV